MPNELFTIGYQGRTFDAFLSQLQANRIECLLDVRQMPVSRKPAFSKHRLAQSLTSAYILYVHLPELGTPKPLRDALKANKDYVTFFDQMEQFIDARQQAIERARAYVAEKRCCLMCYERLAAKCHRKVVAGKIRQRHANGLQVTNL